MENLLYYPYINIPKSDWSARALLYYNHIGSIVPHTYFYQPENYEPFMRQLVMEELVIQIDPLEALNNPFGIINPFIEYVNSKEFNLTKRRENYRYGRSGMLNRGKFPPNSPVINAEKFDSEIFYQLKQLGLAEKQDGSWYTVEKKTANELMTFLASVLGNKINYLPTTDQHIKHFSIENKSKKIFKTYQKQQIKREAILNDLIPFPEQIDILKLRRFKDDHTDLLDRFKTAVEVIALNPNIEEDSDHFKELIKDLSQKKEELSIKMNESKFTKVFFGTVCGITNTVLSTITADYPTIVSNVIGVTSLLSAIHAALQIENDRDIPDQSGMKYLALLDKKISD
jgi:hypothetical protein